MGAAPSSSPGAEESHDAQASLRLPFDVFLDRLEIGWFHAHLIFLCGFGFAAAAVQIFSMALLMAELEHTWNLSPLEVSCYPTASGVASIGSQVVCGILSDKYGRRPVFVFTSFLLAGAAVACCFAVDHRQLLFLRTFVALGYGGNISVDFCLFSEYIPTRLRGELLFVMAAFWPLGQLAGSLIGWATLPTLGWRGYLAVCSALCVVMALLRGLLPESPRWLLVQGHAQEATEVCRWMAKRNGIDPAEVGLQEGVLVALESDAQPLVEKEGARGSASASRLLDPVFELFGPGLRWTTLGIVMFSVTLECAGYTFLTYLPTYLQAMEYESEAIFATMTATSIMEFVGLAFAAIVVTHTGRIMPMRILLLSLGASIIGVGILTTPTYVAAWSIIGAGIQEGAYALFHTYPPEVYPTELRATAISITAAMGNIVSIWIPTAVASMADNWGHSQAVLSLGFICLFTAVVASVALHKETRLQRLEDFSKAARHES